MAWDWGWFVLTVGYVLLWGEGALIVHEIDEGYAGDPILYAGAGLLWPLWLHVFCAALLILALRRLAARAWGWLWARRHEPARRFRIWRMRWLVRKNGETCYRFNDEVGF